MMFSIFFCCVYVVLTIVRYASMRSYNSEQITEQGVLHASTLPFHALDIIPLLPLIVHLSMNRSF